MEIHQHIPSRPITRPVITTGFFDGVHRGHTALINQLIKKAREKDGESVILSFWPHPRWITGSGKELKLLTTLEEKQERLTMLGVDHLILINFSEAFASLTAHQYIEEYLIDKIGIHHLIVGYNHHFGHNREGNYDMLKALSKRLHFTVEQIDERRLTDEDISSTSIRNAILEGSMDKAQKMLGYPYFLKGKIIKGKKIGRSIGFPTANVQLNETYKLLPANGVYAIRIIINNHTHHGMMNIGHNPTIAPGNEKSVEAHIFDFNREIYEENITVEFIQRLRDEEKFPSLDALKKQLEADKQKALNLFAHLKGRN